MMGTDPAAGDEVEVLVQYRLITALQEREHDLAEAQRLTHMGSWSWDMMTDVVTWSDELYRIFGVAGTTFAPSFQAFLALVHPDDRTMMEQTVLASATSLDAFSVDHRIVSGGSQRWLRSRGEVDVDAAGVAVRMHGTTQDVTEVMTMRLALGELNRRFAELAHRSPASTITLYGADGSEQFSTSAPGHTLGDLPAGFDNSDGWQAMHADGVERMRRELRRVLEAPGATMSARYRPGDLESSWPAASAPRDAPGVADPTFEHGVASIPAQISSRAVAHTDAVGASFDPLTGLANHEFVIHLAGQALTRASRHGWVTAVLVIDIDGFSDLNEAFGHEAGDEVLAQLAARLVKTFRASDSVALAGSGSDGSLDAVGRFGVDRFVVVCENVGDVDAAGALAARSVLVVEEPVRLARGDVVEVTAGVGVGVAGPNGPGVEQRIVDAEAALGRAKQRGSGQVEVVAEGMATSRRGRIEAQRALRRAVDSNEFVLHYQAKMSLDSDRICGAEALLRWEDPGRGLVPPLEFITLAEETGLIIPIGTWVIEQACRQAADWQRRFAHCPALVVSVNVSGRQFGPELVEAVAGALAATGIKPAQLCLEVTESILIGDADAAAATLSGLAALGVKLSIDDFGTGYSSLSYLKRFRLHELKIDKSFVDGLGSDDNDTAIVAATVAMAHALGLSVTAEGVETADQLQRLRVLGCQEAQGYFIARAKPVEAFLELLAIESVGGRSSLDVDGSPHPGARYKPQRILVVDDAAGVRQLARMSLSTAGFEVEEVANGAEAIRVARRTHPDCVVLDVAMPDMSGIDVCGALRGDPATAGCTIVMLTSNAAAADKIEAFSCGADDYIIKPFSPRDLVGRVRAAMRRHMDDDVGRDRPGDDPGLRSTLE